MTRLITIFCLFLLLLLHPTFQANATGITVYPEKLNLNIDHLSKENIPVTIKLSNPSSKTAAFDAYLENFPNTLKISPRLVVLGPGGTKTIEIWPIQSEFKKAGNPDYLTLNIVSTELDNNPVLLSAGYKMNIKINYVKTLRTQNKIESDKFLIGLFALGLVILAGLYTKHNK